MQRKKILECETNMAIDPIFTAAVLNRLAKTEAQMKKLYRGQQVMNRKLDRIFDQLKFYK